jgi:hypothetical protein
VQSAGEKHVCAGGGRRLAAVVFPQEREKGRVRVWLIPF